MPQSWLRTILVHNGKTLRIALPLEWCKQREWFAGDRVQVTENQAEGTLTITRVKPTTKRRYTR